MPNQDSLRREANEIRPLLEQYVQDVGLLNRYYNIPLAQEDLDEKRGFFSDCRETLKRLDFGAMGQAARIDYLLFKNQLAYELRKLACQEQRNQEVAELLPFGTTIAELEQQRRRLEPIDPSAIAAQLTQLAAQIEQAREAMVARLGTEGDAGAEEVSKSLANRAATLIDDLRKMLKNWFEFYNDYDPLFTWWAREPYQKSDTALENYASFLREKLVGIKEGEDAPIIGDPVGREALLNELDRAMIPYTPEELVAIAEREFAWCEEEMIRASRELGYGDEWQKAVEHIKRDHVAPGEQPALVKGLALEAIEFLEEHDLVTVPPLARQMWKVEMISPERQKVNPFFMGGETIHVSFPTSAMTHEQKLMSLRGNNVHFARATVHHELIPGHHLQGFTAKRHRPYRRVFTTPFFFEGWALHWEMLLWDLGFARSPENRLGMLFWRMYRCARIIFSLHFHLRKMTPQECIDFVVRRVGHEPANAAAEVRRSCGDDYAPLYQCAYMIGGLQIRALHRELVASGRMTHRQFHDALLRENAIPVEMARASLTNQHLGEDFRSRWRFAGDDFGEA